MMRYKAVFVAVAMAMAFSAFAADPTISVEARQRYPWNGLVDLKFVVTGTSGTKYDTSFTAKDKVGNTNITMRTIRKADGTAAAAKEQLLSGTYNWVWDAEADLPKDWQCDRVTVTGIADVSAFPYSVKFNANGGTGTMSNESFTYGTAKALTANAFTRTGYTFQGWATSANGAKAYSDKQSVSNLATSSGEVVNLYAVWKAALYMVIDLSSGANANSYPISYLDAVPNGGWSDTYKTTKLVLRRIEPGTFLMQNTSNVTLTKPFYIGVFEVTQRQYSLIVGTNPVPSNNKWCYGEMCPVFFVSYNDIRGASTGSGWPTSNGVDDNSFLGKLRVRTQFSFDLPTEAQWEYASRAGSNSAYYWGETMDSSYCWWNDNCSRAQNVGLKNPNYWGLYDTAGNAWEFCLDWYGSLSYGTDPKGSSSNSMGRRVKRGGDWQTSDEDCFKPISNYSRWYDSATWSGDDDSFRICLTLQ